MTYRVSDEEYSDSKEWLRNYINKYCIVRDTRMPGKAKQPITLGELHER